MSRFGGRADGNLSSGRGHLSSGRGHLSSGRGHLAPTDLEFVRRGEMHPAAKREKARHDSGFSFAVLVTGELFPTLQLLGSHTPSVPPTPVLLSLTAYPSTLSAHLPSISKTCPNPVSTSHHLDSTSSNPGDSGWQGQRRAAGQGREGQSNYK